MSAYSTANRTGFFLGPIVFALILLLPLPEGMKPEALKVAAITALMAIWWITEAVPIPATALIPVALYPTLGVMKSAASTAPYANHLIFLFMGGFFIAVTMEKWNLHKRVAVNTIRIVGTSPSRMILGFMVATAFLSMWVSNTATTMMMVPIALAVIKQVTGFTSEDMLRACPADNNDHNFGKSLMLAVAYSASIGGVATIIGTPPNIVMVGMVDKLYGQHISFAGWMAIGVPLAVIMLAFTWLLLTRFLFPVEGELDGAKDVIAEETAKLGPMSKEEKYICYIGLFVCTCWIGRGLISDFFPSLKLVHDATIGILGALLLFTVPTNFKEGKFLLDWKTAVKIPWDVILLFGGGLAIAKGFSSTGLAEWIAMQLTGLEGAHMVVFIGAVVLITIFLTEITSNTATATLLVPVMGSAAIAMGIHPYGPIVGACVAASFAFMLPVATPPNAVVFGSGCITIPQMARAGLWMNIFGAIVITTFITYLLPVAWNIDLSVLPVWATVK